MSVLFLDEADVTRLLTMPRALEVVEGAFRRRGLTEVANIPRGRARTDTAMLHLMGAAAKTLGVMAFKAYTTSKQGARFHVFLYDGKSGEPLAVIQANELGAIRTGAMSGVATKYLARKDAKTAAVIGTGFQARTQLEAVHVARPLESACVFSRDAEKRKQFAQAMSERLGIPVAAADDAQSCVRDAEIVITATTSVQPVVHGDWIEPGTHLNVVGSNFLAKAEIDPATVRKASIVVVDDKEQCRLECGDLHRAHGVGAFHWTDAIELSSLIVGYGEGRTSDDQITLFDSVGVAFADLAAAKEVYDQAKQQGVGKEIDI